MKCIAKIAVVGAALALGLGAASVSAQPFGYGMGPGMMGGYGPGYGMGWSGARMGGYGPGYGMGPQAMFSANADSTEESLAALKSELGITADQATAWQAFADNAKKQNANRQAWFAQMQENRSAGSVQEQRALQAEWMQQRQAEAAANAAALDKLYAALTPEQKAIADQRFGGFGPGWMQGHRGGPRGYRR